MGRLSTPDAGPSATAASAGDHINVVLKALRHEARFLRNLTAWHRLPPREALYGAWPSQVDGRVISALAARGIERPFTHQAEAIDKALAGRHVVVVSGTASGKTLCYNVPVLTRLLADRDARALYLFPTKALAHDQAESLGGLVESLGADVAVHTYDGDTPPEVRSQVRRMARVILSNPDMLHAGMLPHHTKWAEWLRGLRFIVLDELHTYRGVFGSHMANVLRRLRRICRFYGADPCFICCSATVANPLQHAQALLGEAVDVVDSDGSPRGERHLLFYNPPVVDQALGIRRSALLESRVLATYLIEQDVQTLVFARARVAAEVLLTYLQRDADQRGMPATAIRGYRGGYLPSERRRIERDLRSGAARGVVATNALELGVDIGELGAVVMAGYPGTVASTWQQAGRAGRRRNASLAVLVAGGGPLDQYIVTHPDFFLERTPEHALINPDNPLILLGHVTCAAFELPFAAGETFGGLDVSGYLAMLEDEGLLHRAASTSYWVGQSYPAESVSLRTSGAAAFSVVEADSGRTIGTVDCFSAPFLIHEGAIYLHEGESYEVMRLDWEGRRAAVRAVTVDYFTEASSAERVQVVEERVRGSVGVLVSGLGSVRVTSTTSAYRRVRLFTHETLGWGTIDLPEQEMDTQGCWLCYPPELAAGLMAEGILVADEPFDRGPNWQEMRKRARVRDGYRCRHCGAPERADREHDVHHVRPFRAFGYVPGENDRYLAANDLANLQTLCRRCHWLADGAQAPAGSLAGLATALANVVPIYLMCDPRDIGVAPELRSAHTGGPTITFFDRVPGGIGLSERLSGLLDVALQAAGELVACCACDAGCPACVGPVLEPGKNTKQHVLRLVDAAFGGLASHGQPCLPKIE
ncbi:MAG: DEAD/DEAH box helicase [Anaerolineae bacterium]